MSGTITTSVVRLTVALLLVIYPPVQVESSRWWRSPRVVTTLKLSPAQADEIEQVYQAALPARVARAKQADQAHARLTHLIDADAGLWRAKTSKVPRQRWHSRHSWQFRICKLQILKSTRETESLSLRQFTSN